MKTTKASENQGGNGSKSLNHNAIQEFFMRTPLAQRMRPVLAELLWVVRGSPVCHEKVLPDYCYKILGKFKRTYFKALPPSPVGGDTGLPVDWNGLGRVIGIGLRCLRFGEVEIDQVLTSEGCLNDPGMGELLEMIGSASALPGGKTEGVMLEPCPVQKEVFKSQLVKGGQEMWNSFMVSSQSAYALGPEFLAKLNQGAAKGATGFMAGSGDLVGETSRANIYWFLLLAWPEIKQMQEARPRKTRKDFYEWMKPLAQDGLVSLLSLDQLMDVSDRIGLKFADRGAPRTKK